jgi:hypothetical protein
VTLAVDLVCERWYLRALLALARRDRSDAASAEFRDRLSRVDAELARVPLPGESLTARLGVSAGMVDLVHAALAFSVDPRLPLHADVLGGPSARRGLSVAVFAEIAGLAPADGRALVVELGADRPIVSYGVLVCADDSLAPAARPYRVADRVIAQLLGDDGNGVAAVTDDPAWIYDDAQRTALDEIARVLAHAGDTMLVVEGPRGSGRRSAIARALGKPIVTLDADRESVETGLVALRREALLRETLPVIANADALPDLRALVRHAGPLAITTSGPDLALPSDRPIVRVRWNVPDAGVRKQLWARRAGAAIDVDDLAFRYRVGPGAIDRAYASAAMLAGDASIARGSASIDAASLAGGLRHDIAERMGGVATCVEVTQAWDDVVLAEDTLDQVEALIGRVRHGRKVLDDWGYRSKIARGGGVAALFSGPPGTGKTMVAGLVAAELGLELYQVDLSQVVSKWIGETEKQLARVFDAAEEGHALLLFDEADSLFGQRSTEVKGATDRYANLEVNFLLQRIEAFGGITVLTTNLDGAIDRALKRRLAAHIVFAAPDEEERVELWRRITRTATAPLARNIDFTELARAFPTMTGANIRNAVLSAAFLAASANAEQIEKAHLLRAARAEYRSMGHVLAEQARRLA